MRRDPAMKCNFLVGARLLDFTERPSAHTNAPSAPAQRDSCPRLVFDQGVLTVENPFWLDCDSGEYVSFASIVGCCVSGAYSTDTDFCVVFEGRITLRVSLREEDFIGPQAASYRGATGETVNVR
jgi:hypothetical protein